VSVVTQSTDPVFYVYALFRENGVPFYIGKGKGDRWSQHEQAARRGGSGIKSAIIRDMQARGFKVVKVKIHEGLPEEVAHEYESVLIHAIGRGSNGPLVNATDGGEGVTGLRHAKKARESISVAHRGRKKSLEECANIAAGKRGTKASSEARANMARSQTGKTLSAETRAKMSAARRGKKRSPEHCASLSAALRGRIFTPEWRAKMSAARRAFVERQRVEATAPSE
jgi:hypothetical protein